MNIMKFYVNENGAYLGGWDNFEPEGAIEIESPPSHADQIWLFPGWTESKSQLVEVENQWREEQMLVVAEQLVMLEDDDPSALPGTSRQWRDYRIALRTWTDANPDFPDHTKRPVAPA